MKNSNIVKDVKIEEEWLTASSFGNRYLLAILNVTMSCKTNDSRGKVPGGKGQGSTSMEMGRDTFRNILNGIDRHSLK